MADSRENYSGVEMIVQVGSLKLKTLKAIRETIVGLTQEIILEQSYTNFPPATDESIRKNVSAYQKLMQTIAAQLPPEGETREIKSGLTVLASYLGEVLTEKKNLLQEREGVARATIRKVSQVYPSSQPELERFLESVKRVKS
jgi:hypothetical protein